MRHVSKKNSYASDRKKIQIKTRKYGAILVPEKGLFALSATIAAPCINSALHQQEQY